MTTVAGVEISNAGKVLFPDGLTKADLARYYARVAETMLPHVRGRPVHMQRFPDGIDREEVHQKSAPDWFPEFVTRARVKRKGGGTVTHVVIDNKQTLVYLVGQACVTPHVWLSRLGRLDCPDRLVFDLDPSGADLAPVRDAARALRELLERIGLAAYVQTTGPRGLHVVSPLDGGSSFDETRAFARQVASVLAERDPKRLTIEQRKGQASRPALCRHRPQRLRPDGRRPVRRARAAGCAGCVPSRLEGAWPSGAHAVHRPQRLPPPRTKGRPVGRDRTRRSSAPSPARAPRERIETVA